MTIAARLPPHRPAHWPARLIPAVGVALAVVIVTLARWGPDWSAQEFRAWSASQNLTAWTNQWYDGLPLPGYSVLYPLISAVLGAPVTGLLAVVAAIFGAARFTPHGKYRATGYRASVVLVLAADLIIGQVPYLVGVAFGVWTLAAMRARRDAVGLLLAAATSLSSPLAGAFLLLAAPAGWAAYGWRRALPLAGAAAGLVVAVLYGGAHGTFPFDWQGFLCVAIFAGMLAGLLGREDRPLRLLGMTYAAAAVVLYVVPNPVGGNLTRLGQLIALPLLWHVLPRLRWRSRVVAACLALTAAAWPVWPAATSSEHGADDPSRTASYYTGLLGFLHTQEPAAGRLEVVFTTNHWETYFVAQHFPIARGWERQTDLKLNRVLYQPLTAARYRRWLDENGVGLVALPNVQIDYGGKAEAALLRHPPSYLQEVWHDRNWKVWRVRGSPGLVSGPASIRALGTASVALRFRRPGTATVRIRANGMWSVTSGDACVTSSAQRLLAVTAREAGPVVLEARLGLPHSPNSVSCSTESG